MIRPTNLHEARKDSTRPPLVYLPGIDGTGRLLHRQPGLDPRYAVFRANYPQLGTATYPILAAPAVGFLEQHGPGVVLAESFGGAVGLLIALDRPELVKTLVLVNSFAYYPRRVWITLAAVAGRFFPSRPAPAFSRWVRGRFFFTGDTPRREQDEWWERTADVPSSAYGRRLRMIYRLDLRPRLGEVKVPTIVLVSRRDRVVPAEAGRLMAKRIPNARLVEVPTGHAALIHPSVDVARILDECGS